MRLHLYRVFLGCLLTISSCSTPISREQMVEVMIEMYMFDLKMNDFHDLTLLSDTTLVYEAILQKRGYSQKDFNRSLVHHLKSPEKLKKRLLFHRDQMMNTKNALQKAIDDAIARTEEQSRGLQYRILLPLLPMQKPQPDTSATWSVDSIATCKIDSIATWKIDSVATWKIDSVAIGEIDNVATWRIDSIATWKIDSIATWKIDTVAIGKIDTAFRWSIDISKWWRIDTTSTPVYYIYPTEPPLPLKKNIQPPPNEVLNKQINK